MTEPVLLRELAGTTGVSFGTSGVRGLVRDLTDRVCYAYTAGFLQYLAQAGGQVALAGDLRSSTGRILAAVATAVVDGGYRPVYCGRIPSPALAYYGLQAGVPTVMVTGSHIPDDRNGIKFTTLTGELLKADEAGILAQSVALPAQLTPDGQLTHRADPGPVDPAAADAYLARWTDAFPAEFLAGRRLGVYQHSAVGRDLLTDVLRRLGAEVIPLGRTDAFLPVDTEAIREEDIAQGRAWAREYPLDAIISTDGDSDRPFLADEHGVWQRGDLLGILCARYCRADVVVTPVSSNTAVERCGWFAEVRRTRIGSPYVIEAMNDAAAAGGRVVVGYEANGGFLTATPVTMARGVLSPLPTRDPVIVHLAVLGLSRQEGVPVSGLAALLPPRRTASGRITGIDPAAARDWLAELAGANDATVAAAFPWLDGIAGRDLTDGVRLYGAHDEILHLRPSGNAPELRCYTEAATEDRAAALLALGLEAARRALGG